MGKLLLKVSALLLLCTMLYSTVGCGKANPSKDYKQNIIDVIKRDHELSAEMKAPFSSNLSDNEKLDEGARRIDNYVQNAKRSLNYDALPSDFVSAYISHLNAWKQQAQNVANHPDMDFWSNVIDGAIRGLFGDWTGGAFEKEAQDNEWKSRLKQGSDDISSTWSDVETVAAKYGVNVSRCE